MVYVIMELRILLHLYPLNSSHSAMTAMGACAGGGQCRVWEPVQAA